MLTDPCLPDASMYDDLNRSTSDSADIATTTTTTLQQAAVAAVDGESTKFMVPRCFIRTTAATDRVSPTPTLCRLYHHGQCRQGANCHQMHVDRRFLERIRMELRTNPPCCGRHTATAPSDWETVLRPLLPPMTSTASSGVGADDDGNGHGSEQRLLAAAVSSLLSHVTVSFITTDQNATAPHDAPGAPNADAASTAAAAVLSLDELLPTVGLRDVILMTTSTNGSSGGGGAIAVHNFHSDNELHRTLERFRTDGGAVTLNICCPVSRICKNHAPHNPTPSLCRFGDECRYVHCCRKAGATIASTSPLLRTTPLLYRQRLSLYNEAAAAAVGTGGGGCGGDDGVVVNGSNDADVAPLSYLPTQVFLPCATQQLFALPQHSNRSQPQPQRHDCRGGGSGGGGGASIGQGRRMHRVFRTATKDATALHPAFIHPCQPVVPRIHAAVPHDHHRHPSVQNSTNHNNTTTTIDGVGNDDETVDLSNFRSCCNDDQSTNTNGSGTTKGNSTSPTSPPPSQVQQLPPHAPRSSTSRILQDCTTRAIDGLRSDGQRGAQLVRTL